MSQASKPNPAGQSADAIAEDVEEAIRQCDGDARLAVRRLILGQHQMAAEIEKVVSAGYVRRRSK